MDQDSFELMQYLWDKELKTKKEKEKLAKLIEWYAMSVAYGDDDDMPNMDGEEDGEGL